ncbi:MULTISPECIES: hypothetical protein [unclassified Variovorax]|uniref:hypothetical protein n=1 Tax=unclassified Variovorax TaxID=663243 RepID=UPI0013168B9F|nr:MULTISPECIES: hypothetical protein [unclassified Variovorax]VTU42526.1 hypothetical protein H6P1_00213 [Variovorax sp. PBL-H6]VTU43868.1 hypothetical protein SRS16P1_00689 [Variovorax sp. SRS16]VTU43933.1 hypothetical protein E5P1_00682 [Variovorax sp. PBL-E5]
MGRELKRVALDFKWPLEKVWKGFLNPFSKHARPCRQCGGRGESPQLTELHNQWYGYSAFRPEDRGSRPWTTEDAPIIAFASRNLESAPGFYGQGPVALNREAQRLCDLFNQQWSHHLNDDDVAALLEADRLWDFTSTFSPGDGWVKKEPAVVPTAAQVNAWSIGGMGHDSINSWAVIRAECKRLGHPMSCSACEGECQIWRTNRLRKKAEKWTKVEPPAGLGYQIWEHTTEGSPISPVFATAKELAAWMVTEYRHRRDEGNFTSWMKFIEGPGWVPSGVIGGGRLFHGANIVRAFEEEQEPAIA